MKLRVKNVRNIYIMWVYQFWVTFHYYVSHLIGHIAKNCTLLLLFCLSNCWESLVSLSS